MNNILLGFIIALGTGLLATISTIICKKFKAWKSDDVDLVAERGRIKFGMNLFSK